MCRRFAQLGLGRVAALGGPSPGPAIRSAFGRMAEASAGKDSVTGHWEMMGIVLDRPFPVFPNGFSAQIIDEFSLRTGRAVLGNKAASGTEIIDEFGAEHMRTGAWAVTPQPTACSRLPRTKRSCPFQSCTARAKSHTLSSARATASGE